MSLLALPITGGLGADEQPGIVGVPDERARSFVSHQSDIDAIAFSPDGKVLATSAFDDVWLWDVVGKPAKLATVRGVGNALVTKIAFSPDGKWLAFASALERRVALWNVESLPPKQRPMPIAHAGSVNQMAFSPDSKQLITAGTTDRSARVWDIGLGQVKESRNFDHPDYASRALFSPDGKSIAVITTGETICIWDATSEKKIVRHKIKLSKPRSGEFCAFDPSGKWLFEGTRESSGQVVANNLVLTQWDTSTAKNAGAVEIAGGADRLVCVAFSSDLKYVVIGYESGRALIWDVAQKKKFGELRLASSVLSVAFSQDGRFLATGHADGKVSIVPVGSAK